MALTLHAFVLLFLAKLADNSLSIDYRQLNIKSANIPFNYRERIENILCANKSWRDNFAVLINLKEYFEDHFFWEEELANEILNVVNELGKKIDFNIVSEYMSIDFSEKEISDILKRFDKYTVSQMDHFVNLLLDAIYSREYLETFFDYSARSRKKISTITN